jgi:hypothetical protein
MHISYSELSPVPSWRPFSRLRRASPAIVACLLRSVQPFACSGRERQLAELEALEAEARETIAAADAAGEDSPDAALAYDKAQVRAV